MQTRRITLLAQSAALALVLGLSACGGGGGGGSSSGTIPGGSGTSPPPPPPPPPPPTASGTVFSSQASTAEFLTQATFGPTPEDISQLTGTSASEWIIAEFNKAPSLNLNFVLAELSEPGARNQDGDLSFEAQQTPTFSFWINAIEGNDQLRQRMAFALSQILVISHPEGSVLFEVPDGVAYYQDILVSNAFGNYRELLEDVTYSPAMGEYLTYLQNVKGDPTTGRMPDENYAREVMQLFSIGLVDLQQNGEPITQNGAPIDTYSNDDVTGLAKVFTGIALKGGVFFAEFRSLPDDAWRTPMEIYSEYHSDVEKTFLGTVIPAGTNAAESIDLALDALVDHPNTAPFLARQLIQRVVTSHPEPDYIERVASAFASGQYELPNGTNVGDGRRGDLSATIAAVLFDPDAREAANRDENSFGKIREPVLRFTHWARTFNVGTITPEHTDALWDTSGVEALAQGPYRAPSVFNFYRPGYIAPGTETGAAGLTMPELQIINANSVSSYANFMTYFVFGFAAGDATGLEATSFIPDYSDEVVLADDPAALVDHLDLILTSNTTTTETKASIVSVISDFPLENPDDDEYDGPFFRVAMAVLMLMTSPDYIVQR